MSNDPEQPPVITSATVVSATEKTLYYADGEPLFETPEVDLVPRVTPNPDLPSDLYEHLDTALDNEEERLSDLQHPLNMRGSMRFTAAFGAIIGSLVGLASVKGGVEGRSLTGLGTGLAIVVWLQTSTYLRNKRALEENSGEIDRSQRKIAAITRALRFGSNQPITERRVGGFGTATTILGSAFGERTEHSTSSDPSLPASAED